MERNVVSLETAKRLKAAGFPQNTLNFFSGYNGGMRALYGAGKVAAVEAKDTESNWCAAPTAQEIADQLPSHLTIEKQGDSWWADDFDRDNGCFGSTMVETLAHLWIKLNA